MNQDHPATSEALSVLDRFGWQLPPAQLVPLGNAGGMSGAALWKVAADGETLCLRRWPASHPKPDRLAWIHRQLVCAHGAGCGFIPVPRVSAEGGTWVRHAGHLWELTRWMPGEASYAAEPTAAKLNAALEALAQFHRATAQESTAPRRSPGLEDRWQQLQQLTPATIQAHHRAIDRAAHDVRPPIPELARDILGYLPACLAKSMLVVHEARSLRVSLQPCLRDIWHDHVLFQDQRVSGFVDFGAMRVESPAGDVARLLGSMVGDDVQGWRLGLHAYQQTRPLTRDEIKLLAAMDAANVMLAGLNWIRWLFHDRRHFEELDRVVDRLTHIRERAQRRANQSGPFVQQD